MWESLARVNAVVGGVVWGPVGLTLLFGTGCLLTVRTGFFQLRYFGYWMRHTIGAIFLDRNVTAHTDDEAISQFQSLCTALAATIGTGNIVGVAAAILAGGPGAVFWMWVMALLGMMTSYAENVLGICYRRRDAAGRWCGGPMYYLAEGLGGGFGRTLAVLFACFCVLASFGMGNMSQINSIAGNLQAVFRVPPVATGIVLALLTGRVILGGLKRVAAVTEAIVPLMNIFQSCRCVRFLIKKSPHALHDQHNDKRCRKNTYRKNDLPFCFLFYFLHLYCFPIIILILFYK